MELGFRQYLLAGTILAGAAVFGGATPATATVCAPVGLDTDCRLTITLNPGGTGTISTNTAQAPAYDGSDDTLVGVVNNSGQTVTSIRLNGGANPIFAFEGDGLGANPNPTSGLAGAFGASPPAGENTNASHGPTYSGTDSTGANFNLSGPLNSFSNIVGNIGNVNFPGGLAPGATGFFSLEEPLTAASFTVVVTPTPEPATLSILGAALAGFGLLRRRRKV